MKTKALKRFLLTLVFTTLTIALSACSGDKAGESSSQITIGIPQDIEDSLDPHKAVAAGTEEVQTSLVIKNTGDVPLDGEKLFRRFYHGMDGKKDSTGRVVFVDDLTLKLQRIVQDKRCECIEANRLLLLYFIILIFHRI